MKWTKFKVKEGSDMMIAVTGVSVAYLKTNNFGEPIEPFILHDFYGNPYESSKYTPTGGTYDTKSKTVSLYFKSDKFGEVQQELVLAEVPNITIKTEDTKEEKDDGEFDPVNQVKHYQIFPGVEAKDILELVANSGLTDSMSGWEIYCFINMLKYRLRAGNKDDLQQDINKAERYKKCLKPEENQ
jgi:hypothetical protein